MGKDATKKPNNGKRTKQPVSDKAADKVTGKTGDRVMTVRSRRERFNRAEITFVNTTPTTVREDVVGCENFERILNEPQLRCEMSET